MKPIIVTPSAWPTIAPSPSSSSSSNQQVHPLATTLTPGGVAAVTVGGPTPASSIAAAPRTLLPGLPANVFGQLIAACIAQGTVVKNWLSQPALFLPGLVLSISLFIVVVTSVVLWPYGIFQQAAEGLWLYLRGLQTRYALSPKPSEKVAIALTMGLLESLTLFWHWLHSPSSWVATTCSGSLWNQ